MFRWKIKAADLFKIEIFFPMFFNTEQKFLKQKRNFDKCIQ